MRTDNTQHSRSTVENAQSYAVSIVETVREPLVLLDEDLRVKLANRSFYRKFHVTPDETEDHLLFKLGNEQWNIPRLRQLLMDVLPQNTQVEDFEVDRDFPVIGRKVMLLNARRLYDEVAKPRMFLLAIEDITERKRIEEERMLTESHERYRDIVENARDIIFSRDLEGNYTSFNKAGELLTGYTREEVTAMSMAQMIAPEYLEKTRQVIEEKLAGQGETVYDIEIIAKDGRRVAMEVNTHILYLNGTPVGVQGIARDITERKQLEEQLRQSQKMEAIGLLAGGIAHDFNNLLTAITGYSELTLRRLEPGDPLSRNLEEIKRASERAADLTRQLLAFSRKQVLQPKVLDLNVAVSEMGKMLRRMIGEDIELRSELKPNLGRVKADQGQIQQVVMNLVVNARDAMPAGGTISIRMDDVYLDHEYASTHVAVEPGPYVMLAITDTGCGMDEETQSRIFEPFFTTKGQGKGTGLGLSTVYGIVKQSKGFIRVYSELGHGTIFKIYLPRVDDETEISKEAPESKSIVHGIETILLVEDDEMVRQMARTVLEHAGYRVLEARNGKEAIQICKEDAEPIHLVLTDVVMPGMSGRSTADLVKELRPGTSVIYMSGYTEEAIVHYGVLDEGVNFIEKPFTPETLANKVREVLSMMDPRADFTSM